MRRWGLCGSGSIAGASAAASRARASMICWHISACHALGSSADAVPDYSAGFSLPMPDAEASISEEPGARTRHAGICAGAVRATGRPTAMAYYSMNEQLEDPFDPLTDEMRAMLLKFHELAVPHIVIGGFA